MWKVHIIYITTVVALENETKQKTKDEEEKMNLLASNWITVTSNEIVFYIRKFIVCVCVCVLCQLDGRKFYLETNFVNKWGNLYWIFFPSSFFMFENVN